MLWFYKFFDSHINFLHRKMFYKRTSLYFPVFFTTTYNATNREEGLACGPIGYCNCQTIDFGVACEMPIVKIPVLPESTLTLRVVNQNFTNILPSSLPRGLKILELSGNSLKSLPKGGAPFLDLQTLLLSVRYFCLIDFFFHLITWKTEQHHFIVGARRSWVYRAKCHHVKFNGKPDYSRICWGFVGVKWAF